MLTCGNFVLKDMTVRTPGYLKNMHLFKVKSTTINDLNNDNSSVFVNKGRIISV